MSIGNPTRSRGLAALRSTQHPTALREIHPAEYRLDHAAFDLALEAFDAAYRQAFTRGAAHALDEQDRYQAHSEATVEALEAALLAYRPAQGPVPA